MGVTHEIKPDELRNVLKRIHNQYDQIIKKAESKQRDSIDMLCEHWTGENAYFQIKDLVANLNEFYTGGGGSVNAAFFELFELLNSYAREVLAEYGESWNDVSFNQHTSKIFTARKVNTSRYDENTVVDALGGIYQLCNNILKNCTEVQNIIRSSTAISGTGISDMLASFASNMNNASNNIENSIRFLASKIENTSEQFAGKLEKARKEKIKPSAWNL